MKMQKIGSNTITISMMYYRCPFCNKIIELPENIQINFCPACGGKVEED